MSLTIDLSKSNNWRRMNGLPPLRGKINRYRKKYAKLMQQGNVWMQPKLEHAEKGNVWEWRRSSYPCMVGGMWNYGAFVTMPTPRLGI